MATEDVQVPGVTSDPAPEPEPQPEPEPVVKYGDRDIPQSVADSFAEGLGTSRDNLLTKLRVADDYEKNFNDLRKRERAAWEREQRASEIERQWGEFQKTQTVSPQPQAGIPSSEDPMEYLRFTAKALQEQQTQIRAMQMAQEEERQFFKQQLEEQWRTEQEQKADSAFHGLNSWIESESEKRKVRLPQFSMDQLVDEIVESGMAQNRRLSYDEAMKRAYRNLSWDQTMAMSGQAAVDQIRSPKATVVTRSAPPLQAPPQSQGIPGLKLGDIVDFIPEKR